MAIERGDRRGTDYISYIPVYSCVEKEKERFFGKNRRMRRAEGIAYQLARQDCHP